MLNPMNALTLANTHIHQRINVAFVGLLFLAMASVLSSQFAFATTYPVGTLKTNHYLIHLMNDQQSRKYKVFDHSGNLILPISTEQELIAKLPELESLIIESTADQDASLTTHRNIDEFK